MKYDWNICFCWFNQEIFFFQRPSHVIHYPLGTLNSGSSMGMCSSNEIHKSGQLRECQFGWWGNVSPQFRWLLVPRNLHLLNTYKYRYQISEGLWVKHSLNHQLPMKSLPWSNYLATTHDISRNFHVHQYPTKATRFGKMAQRQISEELRNPEQRLGEDRIQIWSNWC